MHCLVKCNWIAPIWFTSPLSLRILLDDALMFSDWIKSWYNMNDMSKHDKTNIRSIIIIFAWNIWKAHNNVVFDNLPFNMPNYTFAAFRMLNESHIRLDIFSLLNVQNARLIWTPLVVECMKLDFDDSFC